MNKQLLVAVCVSTVFCTGFAYAENNHGRGVEKRAKMMEKIDTDKSGDISLSEFQARRLKMMTDADQNSDGVLSKEEIETAVLKQVVKRRAKRLMRHLDVNRDGKVTIEEVSKRQEKKFALLDRNDDGVLSKSEMPRHGMKGKHRRYKNKQ